MAEAIAWFPDQTFAWQRIEDDFYTAKLPNHTAYVRSWLLPPEKIFRRGKCRGSLNDAANNPDSR
jgi:hypothetical protein